MKRIHGLRVLMLITALAATSRVAGAVPVDLGTFSAAPAASVAISADGSSAIFSEDAVTSPISLTGSISDMESAMSLSFQYELLVAAYNEDYFDFFLGDISTPLFSTGGLAGDSPLVFSGVHSVDLRTFEAASLPVIFDFGFGFGDLGLDSQLTISNLATAPIPEPHAFVAMSVGMVLVATAIRRRTPAQASGAALPRGVAPDDDESLRKPASRLLDQPSAPAAGGSL